MSDEYKNFSVLVTQVQQIQIHVLAKDEESAQQMALNKALSGRFATTQHQTQISASWPQFEDEEGPTIADEPGYALRRGWFYVANTDDDVEYAMTEPEMYADCPEALDGQPGSLRMAFEPYVRNNATIFSVGRRYGFAIKLDGDTLLWRGLYPTEREARRAGRRWAAERAKRKAEADRRAAIQATIDLMRAPGNADSLFKTKGGRWSVRSVIGNTTNPGEIELSDDVWWVDIKVVKHLIADGSAKPALLYQKSGDPLAITLTDAVLRPF